MNDEQYLICQIKALEIISKKRKLTSEELHDLAIMKDQLGGYNSERN